MNLTDKLIIKKFHESRAAEFGEDSVESLGWSDTDVQLKRFEVLSGIADLNGHTVLDAGCGHGDLLPFIMNKYPSCSYTGIDHISSLLDIALNKHSHYTEAKFLLGDFTIGPLPETDYILCSGSLNYRSNNPDFIEQTISKLFAACRSGLGFNLLSYVKDPDGILVSYDPEEILRVCRKATKAIQYRDDYLTGDLSFFLYH